ncbi:MAG TPA: pyridoxamine 5'-phosphate oxidase family protein [bacterium]
MTPPRPTRPSLPARKEYGETSAPHDVEDVPWSSVTGRLVKARHFWLVTIGLRSAPHVIPVDAVWHDDRLYFASSPKTVTARNLVRDPRVIAHLEDARAVAIIEGLADRCDAASLPAAVPDLYAQKFGLRLDPSDPEMSFFAILPTIVWTWQASDIRGTSIRWVFD